MGYIQIIEQTNQEEEESKLSDISLKCKVNWRSDYVTLPINPSLDANKLNEIKDVEND